MLLIKIRSFWILLAVIAAVASVYAISAQDAGAVRIGIKSFKTSIDVNLGVIQHSKWTGERPGCFAPYENWDLRYNLDVDSKPRKKSKIISGKTTIYAALDDATGTTPSYGDKGSFKQAGSDASWDLTLNNPAGCPAAPAVPEWATSPTCKKISERVSATLIESKSEGTSEGDGLLQLVRVRKAKPNPFGASIGPSCYRTLHDLATPYVDAEAGIALKSTILTIPVPNLKDKLIDLAKGGAKSRPSFKIKIRYTASCNSFGMFPRTAEKSDWTKSPFTQPHQFLGSFNGEAERSTCSLVGSGSAVVRREGKVTSI